jgi:hypothetical protein
MRLDSPAPRPRAVARAVAMCALGAALGGGAFVGAWATETTRTTADEPHYLLTAESLWADRDLDVANQRAEGAYLDHHPIPLRLQERVEADGSMVSPHDPLLPAVLAVPNGVGGWRLAKLAMVAMSAATAALACWVAIRRLAVRPSTAAVVIGGASLSATWAVYSSQMYPEMAGALTVMVAVAALTSPTPRIRTWLVATTCVALLPWWSVKYAPVAAVLAMWMLWRARRHLPTVAVQLGLLGVAGMLYAVLHQRWYGGWTPYASGSHFGAGEFTVVGNSPDYLGRTQRVVGLFVDQDFGLGAWSPLWLAGIPAVGAAAIRRTTRPLVLVVAAGWLTATVLALTMHGWWFPGRQTVIVLPVIAVLIATWLDRVPSAHPVRVLVRSAAAVGVITTAWLAVSVQSGSATLVVDPFDAGGWMRALWRVALPDLRNPTGVDDLVLIAWTLMAAIAVALSFRSERNGERSVGSVSDAVARQSNADVVAGVGASPASLRSLEEPSLTHDIALISQLADEPLVLSTSQGVHP